MKAQVFRGVNRLSYEDIPVPTIAADEVLVKVKVVGLCQSDIKKNPLSTLRTPPNFRTRNGWRDYPSRCRCEGLANRTARSSHAPYTLYALQLLSP